MKTYNYPDKNGWPEIIARPLNDTQSLEATVEAILQDVKKNGDAALRKYSRLFDGYDQQDLWVQPEEFDIADQIDETLKNAINIAKQNITVFHEAQREIFSPVETTKGVFCWRKNVPIENIGLYIPGGSAPLFSTLLMLGVPAVLAGCSDITICTPCDKQGKINPVILYVAGLLGIKKICKIGGAQAIAALAFGTETVPKVYKIFGPGNRYVTCAKQLVSKEGIAIDMPAGPSEVAVFADETSNAEFVAADLLSQAEHGADSQVLLVTTCSSFSEKVTGALERQLDLLPRKDIAFAALENSKIILFENAETAFGLLNEYAPEHLIIASDNADGLVEKVVNAGSVFIGHWSPESVGDYASGTNHTLPTNGYAKSYSGVSLDSFFKKITFQKLTKEGLQNIGNAVMTMAAAEGLDAHANAVKVRLSSLI